jgi:putative sterol carrier protein
MRAMALTTLHRLLEASFHPPAAAGMDAVLRIQAGDQALTFRIVHGTIAFDPDNRLQPDTTFHFADVATAEALFAGTEDAFDAFMAGRFRADGYLMWAFTLMAMFRSRSLPVTPIE